MATKPLLKWSNKITPFQVERLIRSEKDIKKALLVFDSATAEYRNGFKHDHSTFRAIISKLLSVNQFTPAEHMLDRMKQEHCNVSEDIFLCVCRAYGRVHRPLDAIRVFHKMKDFECEPSHKSYITVFAILVEENQLKIAMRFYQYMKAMGVLPSVVSLNVLIKALCKNWETINAAFQIFHEMPNRGCIPDSYTYGTLISGLCRFGKVCEAHQLFQEMEKGSCLPSVVTYSCLIHGFCQAKYMDEAMGLFQDMKSKGIEPNVFTYSSLMDGVCKDGRSSQALELLEMMINSRLRPNLITYSTLINGFCKERNLPVAVEMLDKMKLQGIKPDAGLYGKIITGFCENSKFQEAANFLDEMILAGISPNRLTWSLHVRTNNVVTQGLCKNDDHNRAFQLYLSMRTRGISVETGTFECLVKCFCSKGELQKATRLLDEMVLDGCVPEQLMWKAVCGFLDQGKVREAYEKLIIKLSSK